MKLRDFLEQSHRLGVQPDDEMEILLPDEIAVGVLSRYRLEPPVQPIRKVETLRRIGQTVQVEVR